MFCKSCNREIPDTEKFCHYCGAPQVNAGNQSNDGTAVSFGNGAIISNGANQNLDAQDYVSIGGWCWLLLGLIPFVGSIVLLIMMIIYALKDPKTYKYPCRVTFCRACLILTAIFVAIAVILLIFFAIFGAAATR